MKIRVSERNSEELSSQASSSAAACRRRRPPNTWTLRPRHVLLRRGPHRLALSPFRASPSPIKPPAPAAGHPFPLSGHRRAPHAPAKIAALAPPPSTRARSQLRHSLNFLPNHQSKAKITGISRATSSSPTPSFSAAVSSRAWPEHHSASQDSPALVLALA